MKNILCFAAHPDDLEFTCTGTLKKKREEGYDLIYVIITNGENGFKKESANAAERINRRKSEQLESAQKLGVSDVIFLDYRDGFLEYTEELRRRLTEIIKKFKPEIVFSFDPANNNFESLNLFHRDHRITAKAVFDACFAAKNKYMYPGEAHRIKKIFFYGTAKPNYVEDITNLINFKLEVLKCHNSQFSDFKRVEDYIRNEVSKRSEKFEYSELFRVIEVRQIL